MQHWVIKTTEGGPTEVDHREDFKRDCVVAVGWARVQDEPMGFTSELQYLARLESQYIRNGSNPNHAASTIYKSAKFWRIGDLAIICEGYAPNQRKDVRLHGLAIVVDYFFDPNPQWRWKFKRRAAISIVERSITKELFVESSRNGVDTMHHPGSVIGKAILYFHRKGSKSVSGLYGNMSNPGLNPVAHKAGVCRLA